MKRIGLLVLILLLTGCFNNKKVEKKKQNTTDAYKFKEEYESLNNKYIELDISENNPIKYLNEDEIKEIINKKSGLVLLGNPKDDKTRVIIPILLEASKQTGIKPIYYLTVDSNEQVQDIINKNNYPLIIFVKDGEVLDVLENDKNKLTKEEENKLLKKYRNTIHEILDDLCDQSC